MTGRRRVKSPHHLQLLLLLVSLSACQAAADSVNSTAKTTAAPVSSSTPAMIIQIVPLNQRASKPDARSPNETLKAQAQSPYGQGISPFGPLGNSPLPPQLIAALQRRQQLLSQQSKYSRSSLSLSRRPPHALPPPYPRDPHQLRRENAIRVPLSCLRRRQNRLLSPRRQVFPPKPHLLLLAHHLSR